MKKKNNKVKLFGFKDKYARRRTTFAIIGIIILLIIIKSIMGMFFEGKEPKYISLLLDNELINLKQEIFRDDNGTIYLSKDDIESIFDKNLYYNEAEKELITTFNKHIALLKVNEKFMLVNDSNVELKSPMIEKDKIVYLPLSDMGIVYDLEFEYSESNKRVIADSVSKEKKRALSLRNIRLKEKPSIFSRKTEKINNGEYLIVIDKEGKYCKVRSSDGNIGYIKERKLSDIEKIRDNWVDTKIDVNIVEEASNPSKKYTNAKLDDKKTNVVVPTFFFVEAGDDGPQILDKTNSGTEEFTNYMNWVKENKIEVWATLSNNSEVSNSLRTYTDRNKIINDLYYILVEHEFQGVNIKFDKIDDINSFNRFIIELTPRLKELGLKVSIKEDKNIDTEKLKDVVDIIIK